MKNQLAGFAISLLLMTAVAQVKDPFSRTDMEKLNANLGVMHEYYPYGGGTLEITREEADRRYEAYRQAKQQILTLCARPGITQEALDTLVNWLAAHLNDGWSGDVAEALPDDAALASFIRTIEGKMKLGDRFYTSVGENALHSAKERWGKSPDPAVLKTLIHYMQSVITAKVEEDWVACNAYQLLEKNYAKSREFTAFLWEYAPGFKNGEDRYDRFETLGKLIAAYDGPAADSMLIQAFARKDKPGLQMANQVALARVSKMPAASRGRLIAALQAVILGNIKDENIWRDSEKALEKILPDTGAVTAYLQICLKGGEEAWWARNVVVELLDSIPSRLTRGQWAILLDELKKKNYKIMGLVAAADLTPVISEIIPLVKDMDYDAERAFYSGLRKEKASTRLEMLTYVPREKPTMKCEIISSFEEQPLDPKTGRAIAAFLKDADKGVVQSAFSVLMESKDTEVIKALKQVREDQLNKEWLASVTLRTHLKMAMVLPRAKINAGDSCAARLLLTNEGYFSLKLPVPSGRFGNSAKSNWWLVLKDKRFYGPLAFDSLQLVSGGQNELKSNIPAPGNGQVVHPGKPSEYGLELGGILAAFGPGKHSIGVAYFSRVFPRHGGAGSDFCLQAPEKTIEIQAGPAWKNSPAGTAAAINSPDTALRNQGWKQLKPDTAVLPPDKPWVKYLRELGEGKFQGKRLDFAIHQEDQEIRSEQYAVTNIIDGKFKFEWHWDEEDVRGGGELPLKPDEVREFFKLLRAGAPFDREPLQKYGGAYENKAEIHFGRVIDGDEKKAVEKGEFTGVSQKLWIYELSHHPRYAPWFKQILLWKKKSSGEAGAPETRRRESLQK